MDPKFIVSVVKLLLGGFDPNQVFKKQDDGALHIYMRHQDMNVSFAPTARRLGAAQWIS